MGDSEEKRIKLSVVAEKMKLTNLTPDINLSKKYLTAPEVNRPALHTVPNGKIKRSDNGSNPSV